jgi:hypothetical protein
MLNLLRPYHFLIFYFMDTCILPSYIECHYRHQVHRRTVVMAECGAAQTASAPASQAPGQGCRVPTAGLPLGDWAHPGCPLPGRLTAEAQKLTKLARQLVRTSYSYLFVIMSVGSGH